MQKQSHSFSHDDEYTISQVVHELRTPLTLISSSFQIIQTEHPEVTAFPFWSGIQEDLKQMACLLSDLSSYHHGNQLSTTSIPVGQWLKEVCSSFMPALIGSPVRLLLDIEPKLPVIQGDPQKLRQVVMNLLHNALDSFQDKGTISVHAWSTQKDITIEIDDTGCGIPKERQKNIFQPFVTYKENGTGLGLAIAKRLIHAHGGTLTLCSLVHVGTCFLIRLPIVSPVP